MDCQEKQRVVKGDPNIGAVGRWGQRASQVRSKSRDAMFRLCCSNRERSVAYMKLIQAVCDKCKKTVEAKPLLSENELWLALNKGDEIEVMHLADDVHHTWKLTGQDQENLRKARAAGTV
jgi:hypothetical protein